MGRKKATPEQKRVAQERQKERVKIANIVYRDETIDRKCCICGSSNSPILHNKNNSYNITFLCYNCRKTKDNIKKAEEYRFDLKEYKAKQIQERETNSHLDTRKFSLEEVKQIVEGYNVPNNTLTFGEYADMCKISRHQFSMLQKRYLEYFPDKNCVIMAIHNRSKAIQRHKLSIRAIENNYAKMLLKSR